MKINHAVLDPRWQIVALLAFMSVPAHAGTIVYLQGNDNTLDSSGNNNNGSWVGTPSYIPGVVGDAFNLTGGNYVVVPAGPSLSIPPDSIITLSAYVDPTSFPSSERIIDSITAGGDDGYLLDIIDDNLRFIAGSTSLTGTYSIPVGTFTLVTAVFDGTLATPTLSIYENGTLDATETSGTWVESANDLRIGAASDGTSDFVGAIGQASITSSVPEPAGVTLIALGLGFVTVIRAYRSRTS